MQVNLNDLIDLTDAIRSVQPEVHTFEFSRYVYRPQTIADERNVFFLPAPELRGGFEAALSSLKPEEEIAINSRVYLRNGEMRHIPMLDLIGDFDPANVPVVKSCLAAFSIPRFRLYSSGRSFHLYGIGCLPPERYEKFLGRALLMNLPGALDIVDQRWVGHRILGGFATLRWTNRSGYYVACPKFEGEYQG